VAVGKREQKIESGPLDEPTRPSVPVGVGGNHPNIRDALCSEGKPRDAPIRRKDRNDESNRRVRNSAERFEDVDGMYEDLSKRDHRRRSQDMKASIGRNSQPFNQLGSRHRSDAPRSTIQRTIGVETGAGDVDSHRPLRRFGEIHKVRNDFTNAPSGTTRRNLPLGGGKAHQLRSQSDPKRPRFGPHIKHQPIMPAPENTAAERQLWRGHGLVGLSVLGREQLPHWTSDDQHEWYADPDCDRGSRRR